MFKLNIIFVIINLIVVIRKIKAEVCPKYCTCDLYHDFNRADCSFQRLINSNVGVPSGVEILNLNNNDINILDNSAFEGLPNLLNLTLSDNGIGTVYLDAFATLPSIEYIDLANNRLEEFDSRIFETCKNLIDVDLSGNKFMSMKNEAFLKSSSLQSLKLSAAQINHIYPKIFDELPELLTLDLSDNLLITLNKEAFGSLKKLKFINLSGNRWLCDNDLKITIDMLKKKGVNVLLNACPKFANTNNKEHMFERMVMAPPIQMEEEADTAEFVNETNVEVDFIWKNIKPVDCIKQDHESVCKLYDECQRNLNEVLIMKTNNEHDLPKMYTTKDLNIVMLVGICLGIAIMSSIISIYFCLRGCYFANKRAKHRNAPAPHQQRISSQRHPAVSARIPTYPRPVIEPPPRLRRCGRTILNRSLSAPTRQNTTNRVDNFGTFLTRLFERPINRNVIRRISTLNNRISQHFRDNSSSIANTASSDTEQLIRQPTQPISEVNVNRNRWQNAANIVNTNMEQEQQHQTPTPRELTRPETPPPSYSDCIHLGG